MSELKEHLFCECDECIREYRGPLSNEMRPYYLKSEADKVIAELKAQKAQAEDDCAYWKMCHGNASNAMHETEEYAMQLYNEARHQKYKRCLAMAVMCSEALCYWDNVKYTFSKGEAYCFRKLNHYGKWGKIWLVLSEKFKEAK